MDNIEVKYRDYTIYFREDDEMWCLKTKDDPCIYRSGSLKKVKDNVDFVYNEGSESFKALRIKDSSGKMFKERKTTGIKIVTFGVVLVIVLWALLIIAAGFVDDVFFN